MSTPGAEKVVVIALGNRLRGDDGLGPSVAERLDAGIGRCRVVAGRDDAMAIINAWEGADLAVVVDAAVSGGPPGTIRRLALGETPLPRDLARCSSHGLGLAEAVELGEALGRLPARLVVYAVEAKSFAPGAGLTREVAAAVDAVVRKVEAEIASLAEA